VTALAPGITLEQARRAVAALLRARGIETPELDARIIVGHAVQLAHTALLAAAQRPLSQDEARHLSALAERRLAGEPVSRIIGQREFWSLPLLVSPDVLVPRPETETVVELALALTDQRDARLRIADLGTGSGAILLALLSELNEAFGVGTDISPKALETAQANARNLGLGARAVFLACDYGSALGPPFDLVVSNPPYIATRDIAALDAEVRAHDPRGALDGGEDGLNAYRAIAADAGRLIGRGHLVVEIGAGQAREVEAIFAAKGLAVSARRHDLSGETRALALRQA